METYSEKIFETINRSFEKDGYKIPGGHFEIGRRLHCETYFFAKKFFQKRENCEDLAALLMDRLNKAELLKQKTTLVGFGNYCGLFLNMATENIPDINYAILEKQGESFTFQTRPQLHENIIVILPITCTCATYFKIKYYIEHYANGERIKLKINNQFVSVFVIIHDSINPSPVMRPLHDLTSNDNDARELYNSYGWHEMSDQSIRFKDSTPDIQYTSHSLIQLKSKLYLPELCPICFPERQMHTCESEKFLFLTDAQYETPNLILGLPQFSDGQKNSRLFNELLGYTNTESNPHLHGNILIDNTHYQSFIRGDVFYNRNKEKILDFFSNKLLKVLKEKESVLFITSDHKHGSSFLEDLTRTSLFNDKEVTILRYQPFQEFVDNFVSIYSKAIESNSKVIYYEDVLSGGKTFKLISDYLKHSKNKEEYDGNPGFDLLLCLIDRTTNYTKDELLRKLSTGIKNHGDYIPYFKLNVPIISSTHMGDPLKESQENLKRLIHESHLDALKKIIVEELQRNRSITLQELESSVKRPGTNYLYFPAKEKDEQMYLFYQPFFTQHYLNYIKLYLTHEINTELLLLFRKKSEAPPNIVELLLENISNPLDTILETGHYSPPDSPHRRPELEMHIIRNIVISILSKPPFIYYQPIYKSIFSYSVQHLHRLHEHISGNTKQPVSANDFIDLKNLIRRSVELNSNYIISHSFLLSLRNDFTKSRNEKRIRQFREQYEVIRNSSDPYSQMLRTNLIYKYNQLISYNYFLLYCYKALISRNPGRSIRLEELLNDKELQPEIALLQNMQTENNDHKKLKELWQDSYYLFYRIVKSENIYLLNELKDLHKKRVQQENRKKKQVIYQDDATIDDLIDFYFKKTNNDAIIKNAVKLIGQSTYKNNNRHIIEKSVCAMLRVHNVLEKCRKKHQKSSEIYYSGSIYDNKLDKEIRIILDAVADIIKPGMQEGELKYAFFIEYRAPEDADNPGKKENSENIYTVLSHEKTGAEQDNTLINLHRDGLIYNALYGLSDTVDDVTPQTLLFAGKLIENGVERYHSFQDAYFRSGAKKAGSEKPGGLDYKDKQLKEETLLFNDMLQRDLWNSDTKTGIKLLNDAGMVLVFRLSNLIGEDHNYKNHRLKGQAVLMITTTAPATMKNFMDFMNIEKIRLLLLIKEELLDYLQKQFDNDAFIEVLENLKRVLYQRKLEHGINRYLEIQTHLFDKSMSGNNAEENQKNRMIHEIVKNAIKGQIRFKYRQSSIEQRKPYTVKQVKERMQLLLESVLIGDRAVVFDDVNCSGFEDVAEIYMHPSVFDIVIPEVIINMKRYSSAQRKDGLKIKYSAQENYFIFTNNVRLCDTLSPPPFKLLGGANMCAEIMRELNYESFESKRHPGKNDTHVTIIKLNQQKDAR